MSFNIKGATAETAVVNDYKAQTTTLEGNKTWDDNDDQDGKRPESITIRVFDGDKQVAVQEVTAEDNWSWKFEGLREYRGGEKIVYTITEDPIEGYTSVVNGYDVTNTHAPETVEISGSKTWNDVNNQDGVRPESITIRLLQNGTEIDSVTVTAGDNWAWSFTDLPKYATGQEIVYTITEDSVSDYFSEVNGYDVTNTHEPETMVIEGFKTWDDAENQDGMRPESITIRVLANGEEVASKQVTATDNWTWFFTDLPRFANGEEIVYTIAEDAVPEYSSEIDGYDVTNTHTPGQTSVQVTKAWDDADDQDGVRPDSVTIKLIANGEATDKELTLNADNNWTGTFTELDEYAAGDKIVYTVEEVEIGDGYTTTITGDATEGYVVTNSRTPATTELEGMKTWQDDDNQDGIRPDSITVRVLANGEQVASKQVTAEDDWTWSFTDLPVFDKGQVIEYTIIEDEVEGYETFVDGFNLVNSHEPEMTMVEGSKTWDDNDNQNSKRPESITIRLLADGEEVASKQVTADDDWAWSFTDLPKFNSGKEIVYTITEDEVDGYTTTVDGYNVTNKIIPEEPKKPTLPKTGVATGTFLGVGTLLFVAGAALVGMRKRRS
ncbi:MAG: Cna B-type domain-containing protein [Acidobacteriota bacterium]|nr:Cna B-type domain-containing protein [Acidobacteriota bacterium]